jgi:ubiquitin
MSSKSGMNNRSNQLNPNNDAYHSSRDSKSGTDNRSNQLNPNNDAYHSSRGVGGGDDHLLKSDATVPSAQK